MLLNVTYLIQLQYSNLVIMYGILDNDDFSFQDFKITKLLLRKHIRKLISGPVRFFNEPHNI